MKKVTLALMFVALMGASSEVNASGPTYTQRAKAGLSKLGTNLSAAGTAVANSRVGQAVRNGANRAAAGASNFAHNVTGR